MGNRLILEIFNDERDGTFNLFCDQVFVAVMEKGERVFPELKNWRRKQGLKAHVDSKVTYKHYVLNDQFDFDAFMDTDYDYEFIKQFIK